MLLWARYLCNTTLAEPHEFRLQRPCPLTSETRVQRGRRPERKRLQDPLDDLTPAVGHIVLLRYLEQLHLNGRQGESAQRLSSAIDDLLARHLGLSTTQMDETSEWY